MEAINRREVIAVLIALAIAMIVLISSEAQDNMCQFGDDYGWHGWGK